MSRPMVYPDSPNVRATDPIESHEAADLAVSKQYTIDWVTRALRIAKKPIAWDMAYEIAYIHGFRGSPERVRTVLAEGKRDGIFIATSGGRSQYGRRCRVWTLADLVGTPERNQS